jgi:hypothetical protein
MAVLSSGVLIDAIIAAGDAADLEHALEQLVGSVCRSCDWIGGHALAAAAPPLPPFISAASWYSKDGLTALADVDSSDALLDCVDDAASCGEAALCIDLNDATADDTSRR